MHKPLYLKYRPQTLAELAGQSLVALALSNAIKLDKLHHAYIFSGPRGCGKTSTARILAKSINCASGPTEAPCGTCQNCREITLGISPDVLEVDAATNRKVEDVSTYIERCHLGRQLCRRKIYIFDEVHMLSTAAFNSLLKTIEEPPVDVTFILATTEEHKVPSTIISRCQRCHFRPIPLDTLKQRLQDICMAEQFVIEEDALTLIARQSRGGMRDALNLLEQVSVLAESEGIISTRIVTGLFGGVDRKLLNVIITGLCSSDLLGLNAAIDRLFAAGVSPNVALRNLLDEAIELFENQLINGIVDERLARIIDALFEVESSFKSVAFEPESRFKSGLLNIAIAERSKTDLLARIERLERSVGVIGRGDFDTSPVVSVSFESASVESHSAKLFPVQPLQAINYEHEALPQSSVNLQDDLLERLAEALRKAGSPGLPSSVLSCRLVSLQDGRLKLSTTSKGSAKTLMAKVNYPKVVACLSELLGQTTVLDVTLADEEFASKQPAEPIPSPEQTASPSEGGSAASSTSKIAHSAEDLSITSLDGEPPPSSKVYTEAERAAEYILGARKITQ